MSTRAAMQQMATCACILHAVVVSLVWFALFISDVDVVRVRTWVQLAALWPAWALAFILPSVDGRRWAIAMVVGTLVLVPTIPTLYSFASWSAFGFAP